MKLLPIDYDRRQRIYALSYRRALHGMRALVLSMRGRDEVIPPGAVYIGRATKRRRHRRVQMGNSFTISKHGNRDEVIARYREWIATQLSLLAALPELRGKDLACWCAPQSCHGDVLLELANSDVRP